MLEFNFRQAQVAFPMWLTPAMALDEEGNAAPLRKLPRHSEDGEEPGEVRAAVPRTAFALSSAIFSKHSERELGQAIQDARVPT